MIHSLNCYLTHFTKLSTRQNFICFKFALLYLLSDSTTVPLADAKLSGPCDAFKKGLQLKYFLSLLKRDDIIWNPATRPFFNASGPLCNFKSSHQRQGVLRDCLQSQIGTVVKQSVLSYGFAFDEFWPFSKNFDTLISEK